MFEEFDEDLIRRIVAGLITITDAQIGRVVEAMERLNLMDTTRIIYTSDHGEAAGNHGILGKANHYEHSLGVPLQREGINPGTIVDDVVSLVDLFPTIVEGVGAELAAEDNDLPGQSLWGLASGVAAKRKNLAFSEFHAMGSLNASFAIRSETLSSFIMWICLVSFSISPRTLMKNMTY